MTTATLAGQRVTRARLSLAAWGCPFAEVSIDGEAKIDGAVELVIADMTLKGTVLSGGPEKGRGHYRVVGGFAGWGKRIPKKSYATDAGVRLADVLKHAADDAGEQLDLATVSSSKRVGPAFARQEGLAIRVLEQYASQNWYIGEDGVTRLGRRPRTELATTAARVVPADRARGTLTLASATIAKLVPGVVIDGLEAVDVEHTISADEGLRTQIWSSRATVTSRALSAFMRLFDLADPDRAYRGPWEYRVVTQEGDRLNLQSVRSSSGMPDLRRVRVRYGIPGAKANAMLGARVIVQFVDADPARPVVVAFEEPDGDGFKPILLSLDAQTVVQIADGVRPMAATGDLAGGILPIVGTTRVMG